MTVDAGLQSGGSSQALLQGAGIIAGGLCAVGTKATVKVEGSCSHGSGSGRYRGSRHLIRAFPEGRGDGIFEEFPGWALGLAVSSCHGTGRRVRFEGSEAGENLLGSEKGAAQCSRFHPGLGEAGDSG